MLDTHALQPEESVVVIAANWVNFAIINIGNMAVTKENRAEVVTKFQHHAGDTGSSRVQVALITQRINDLQEHFTTNKKDHHSRRGLLKLVGQRKRLLDYIKTRDVQEYRTLVGDLGIRK